jgi:hypothetical protein
MTYEEATRLTRLLAIAVAKLGGRLEVPTDAIFGSRPEFVISTKEDILRDTVTVKVREVRRELGEVLDVSQLEKAEYEEIGTLGKGTLRKMWVAKANGAIATCTTKDLEAEFYVSPILTMRTIGVALVDSTGAMVDHNTRTR